MHPPGEADTSRHSFQVATPNGTLRIVTGGRRMDVNILPVVQNRQIRLRVGIDRVQNFHWESVSQPPVGQRDLLPTGQGVDPPR